jgi:NTP pyrophosphatase (non-canonical NTP hydrolase)
MTDMWKMALDVENENVGWELYTKLAQRTSSNKHKMDKLQNGIIGLCGESGECIDLYKKHKFQGHDLDKDKLKDELSDILWYTAELSVGLDKTLDAVVRRGDFEDFEDIARTINKREYMREADKLIYKGLLEINVYSGDMAEYLVYYLDGEELYTELMEHRLFLLLLAVDKVAYAIGTNLKDVAEYNIGKLYKRYPEGFSADRSINREV